MLDLTQLNLRIGPWAVGDGYSNTGIIEDQPGIWSEDDFCIAQVADVTETPDWNMAHARVLAASYEILEALIEVVLDEEKEYVVADKKKRDIIEKATGLPWPEVKQRLGV